MTAETTAAGGVGLGRGGRMSRQRKRDAVVRLLRGEDLEILSRALGVTAATLTGWRDTFVAGRGARLAPRAPHGAGPRAPGGGGRGSPRRKKIRGGSAWWGGGGWPLVPPAGGPPAFGPAGGRGGD